MCSERYWGSAARERPVDRLGICCCSAPESIQVVLKRIQILSFDASTVSRPGVGSVTWGRASSHQGVLAA
jgi:hypothetical protein